MTYVISPKSTTMHLLGDPGKTKCGTTLTDKWEEVDEDYWPHKCANCHRGLGGKHIIWSYQDVNTGFILEVRPRFKGQGMVSLQDFIHLAGRVLTDGYAAQRFGGTIVEGRASR